MEAHERKRCARLSVVRPAIGALATRPAGLDQLALGKGWALATHVRRRAPDTVGRPGHGDLEFRGYGGSPGPRKVLTASPPAPPPPVAGTPDGSAPRLLLTVPVRDRGGAIQTARMFMRIG